MENVQLSKEWHEGQWTFPPAHSTRRAFCRHRKPCWEQLGIMAKMLSNLSEQSSGKVCFIQVDFTWVHFSPYKFLIQRNDFNVKNIFTWKIMCASSISAIQSLAFKITLLFAMWVMNRIRNRNVFRRESGALHIMISWGLLMLSTVIESTAFAV